MKPISAVIVYETTRGGSPCRHEMTIAFQEDDCLDLELITPARPFSSIVYNLPEDGGRWRIVISAACESTTEKIWGAP